MPPSRAFRVAVRLRLPWPLGPRRPAAHRTGRRGERAAQRTLQRRGYVVLGRNLRTPEGEIDLLALDGRVLVVVEVKTRRGESPHPAAPRIRAGQRRRLERAARWLAQRARPRPPAVRIDLVAVRLGDGPPQVTIQRGGA